jgi:hypothetical protein
MLESTRNSKRIRRSCGSERRDDDRHQVSIQLVGRRADAANAAEAGTTLPDLGEGRSRSAREKGVETTGEAGRLLIGIQETVRVGSQPARSLVPTGASAPRRSDDDASTLD